LTSFARRATIAGLALILAAQTATGADVGTRQDGRIGSPPAVPQNASGAPQLAAPPPIWCFIETLDAWPMPMTPEAVASELNDPFWKEILAFGSPGLLSEVIKDVNNLNVFTKKKL
jgi:hypothetical protein